MQEVIKNLIQENLFAPLWDLSNCPLKRLRSELMRIFSESLVSDGASSGPQQSLQTEASQNEILLKFDALIEGLHEASLILDDIEDESPFRRGDLSLHRKYGLNKALNAGCFRYFQSLQEINSLNLSPEKYSHILKRALETIQEAHMGQTLDLFAPVLDLQSFEIIEVCQNNLKWKSGSLMGFSCELGVLSAGASLETAKQSFTLGQHLGVFLQQMDDLGSFSNPESPKYLEDFRSLRPGYVWQWAAELEVQQGIDQTCTGENFKSKRLGPLKSLQKIAEQDRSSEDLCEKVGQWCKTWDLPRGPAQKCRQEILNVLRDWSLKTSLPEITQEKISDCIERISHAYVQH